MFVFLFGQDWLVVVGVLFSSFGKSVKLSNFVVLLREFLLAAAEVSAENWDAEEVEEHNEPVADGTPFEITCGEINIFTVTIAASSGSGSPEDEKTPEEPEDSEKTSNGILELLESSAEFESVVVVDIVDLVLWFFVPADQVSDFFAQVHGTEEEAEHEPSGDQCSCVDVLSAIGIPDWSLFESQGFGGVDTMGCHDNRFDVLVVPALNVFVFIACGASIFVRESANTSVFFLVQACLGVPEPKV